MYRYYVEEWDVSQSSFMAWRVPIDGQGVEVAVVNNNGDTERGGWLKSLYVDRDDLFSDGHLVEVDMKGNPVVR